MTGFWLVVLIVVCTWAFCAVVVGAHRALQRRLNRQPVLDPNLLPEDVEYFRRWDAILGIEEPKHKPGVIVPEQEPVAKSSMFSAKGQLERLEKVEHELARAGELTSALSDQLKMSRAREHELALSIIQKEHLLEGLRQEVNLWKRKANEERLRGLNQPARPASGWAGSRHTYER